MGKLTELTVKIDGMHCAGCAAGIERGVSALGGVRDCRVNLATRSAVVIYDGAEASDRGIMARIRELGYGAAPGSPDILVSNVKEEAEAGANFIRALLLSLPLMVVAMWPMIAGRQIVGPLVDGLMQAPVAALVLFWAGWPILHDAVIQARHFRANMNSLIAIGTLAAFGWSLYVVAAAVSGSRLEPLYFDSSAMIIALILFGRYLESRARGRAGRAIEALLGLKPARALAVINNVEIEIDTDAVNPGMVLIVRPGERVAADGRIILGKPVIDESMLTGESIPVDKKEGDQVIGGSLNGNLPFHMKVTASGEQTFLASVIRLVSEAQGAKAPVQRLADRVAAIFVPAVIGLAALTLLAWYLFAPDSPMLIRSVIAVLIIACPCALGLATPTAILVGTGRAARHGIIVRGGDVLEKLTTVDAVVFDKTGTLTEGVLQVVGTKTFGDVPERIMLRYVASVETHSEHPVAKAIVGYARWQQVEPIAVAEVEAFPGFGIVARCEDHRVAVGNSPMMNELKVNFGRAASVGEREMEKGHTVVFVAVDDRVVGLITLADRLRTEAHDVIAALKKRVSRVVMLSGDTHQTARGVASALGIDEFQAGIRPEQKRTVIETLTKAGLKVAMVGDGINDAPALAAATVGVAIGSGTDVAIETADVVLVRSQLTGVIEMFRLARASLKIIKQNLFWAFAYNVLAIPIAAGVFYPFFGFGLSPMIAAAAMAFSSVFVVTNSLRLGRMTLT